MNNRRRTQKGTAWAVVLALGALSMASAVAHNPWQYRTLYVDGPATSLENPLQLDSAQIMSAFYFRASGQKPALWIRFDGTYGDAIQLRMGIPAKAEYASLRPVAVIAGAECPAPDRTLPFALPEGWGAMVYDTARLAVADGYEGYTGARSYQFETQSFTLPASGTYYIAVYFPTGPSGKCWLTVGAEKKTRLTDLFTVPVHAAAIRAFFEISPLSGWGATLDLIVGLMLFIVGVVAVSPN
ncbi:MAG TPA: hypothetical protein PLO53_04485 [Candidatus Hydrogenedentes bacterium]|nr:hypothetical protein [Candidatus Hydrogenedentota bacterium]HPU97198.1 hypothetical protein [Candidatus Hydrogenedentota bacterium]